MDNDTLQLLLDTLYESVAEEDFDKVDEAIEIITKEIENPINDYDKNEEW